MRGSLRKVSKNKNEVWERRYIMKRKPCKKPSKYPRTSTIIMNSVKLYTIIFGIIIGSSVTMITIRPETEIIYVKSEPEVMILSMVREVPIEEVNTEPEIQRTYLKPCSTTSTFKSYMDYRMITNQSSRQYQLQKNAYTENGYRKLDGRKMIAIANFNVGDELDITLSSGEILETIVGDVKANTSCTHPDSSLIEMIVDTNTMDPLVKKLGNYDKLHTGSIVTIAKLHRDTNVH